MPDRWPASLTANYQHSTTSGRAIL